MERVDYWSPVRKSFISSAAGYARALEELGPCFFPGGPSRAAHLVDADDLMPEPARAAVLGMAGRPSGSGRRSRRRRSCLALVARGSPGSRDKLSGGFDSTGRRLASMKRKRGRRSTCCNAMERAAQCRWRNSRWRGSSIARPTARSSERSGTCRRSLSFSGRATWRSTAASSRPADGIQGLRIHRFEVPPATRSAWSLELALTTDPVDATRKRGFRPGTDRACRAHRQPADPLVRWVSCSARPQRAAAVLVSLFPDDRAECDPARGISEPLEIEVEIRSSKLKSPVRADVSLKPPSSAPTLTGDRLHRRRTHGYRHTGHGIGAAQAAAAAASSRCVRPRKVGELIREEGNDLLKLRVFVSGGGCSGFQYGLHVRRERGRSATPASRTRGVKLLVDPTSIQYLRGRGDRSTRKISRVRSS